MKGSATDIEGVRILEPQVFCDDRGFFFESYNTKTAAALGIDIDFVQDNHSMSLRGTLRGLHYQVRRQQAKLVRVVCGEVFDVAVDLRRSSPTFGRWFGVRLSALNRLQLFLPEGFGHGFQALSDTAEVLYKASDFYAPDQERCIRWNDPDLAIDWPLPGEMIISAKDAAGSFLRQADLP
ncbi:MAG: dTDP-4-dehydrorhamnose 3,5-epimerase [Syntrophobacteraceae bacterium]|nr:dTDP-4-dehydrorhamnose 3,5-epimerase [Syntrophobacteraceae bacterium]